MTRPSFALVLLLSLLLCACGTKQPEGVSHMYVMDGPPLFLVGKLGDLAVEGSMDRTCMAGVALWCFRPAGNKPAPAAFQPNSSSGRTLFLPSSMVKTEASSFLE